MTIIRQVQHHQYQIHIQAIAEIVEREQSSKTMTMKYGGYCSLGQSLHRQLECSASGCVWVQFKLEGMHAVSPTIIYIVYTAEIDLRRRSSIHGPDPEQMPQFRIHRTRPPPRFSLSTLHSRWLQKARSRIRWLLLGYYLCVSSSLYSLQQCNHVYSNVSSYQ